MSSQAESIAPIPPELERLLKGPQQPTEETPTETPVAEEAPGEQPTA
jgi:hypothetical protein